MSILPTAWLNFSSWFSIPFTANPRACLLASMCFLLMSEVYAQKPPRPNVVLIITDDQGYGDVGFTGNPHIQTPEIDRLAKESLRFTNFYVSPVCAPTRASLMTGRYSLRTGIRDTYNGGAIMSPDEVTLAEILHESGYQTGAFGKWHLGDNFPSRPNDQGFKESLIHLAGGMGQPGDITTFFKGDSSYFDPVLWYNGRQKAYEGYCSDIFTTEAISFIADNQDEPFFCYLAFNAPHTPLQVPEGYLERYEGIDPTSGFSDKQLYPSTMTEKDKEDARRVYAMVSNIDDNIGRLRRALDSLGVADNTLLIFMTDNGNQQTRYNVGMRGKKGSVYRGGVRVPFLLWYPRLGSDRDIEGLAAHIDVMPTLASLCQATPPAYRQIDGLDLIPMLRGTQETWPSRGLFFYWTRKYPELYQNMAYQKGRFKLLAQTDFDAPLSSFELYDLEADPGEQKNVIASYPKEALALRTELDALYQDLVRSPHLVNPPLIELGDARENPSILNRNDAGGDRSIWVQEQVFGKWAVHIQPGRYTFRFKFLQPMSGGGRMVLETGSIIHQKQKPENATSDQMELVDVPLPEITGDLIPYYEHAGKRYMPLWVEVEKLDK